MDEVRLSLCMIVKNEEKNMEKALGWAKNVAFEMIVADTGSTDRTVEIAVKMGAKVFNFEWINDFSAARNFAIDKATGNWICILDADEYFPPGEAEKLINFIQTICSKTEEQIKYQAVSCMIVNLDDKGRHMTKSSTVRVFRNIPSIRYVGRIHEQPTINISDIIHASDITIMHTGYSESAHTETGKGQRNIALLRRELAVDPGNLNLKMYLANSLSMSTDEKSRSEAEELFDEVINSGKIGSIPEVLRIKMYIYMISKYMNDPDKIQECIDMCNEALIAFPGAVDFEYLYATALMTKGEYSKAWELLKNCEATLLNDPNPDDSIMIPADPTILFSRMIIAAKRMDDIENVILYSTHVLSMDKTRKSVLGPCIATLLFYGVSESETIELLSNIYNMRDPGDLLFIANTAKEHGATGFADKIRSLRR